MERPMKRSEKSTPAQGWADDDDEPVDYEGKIDEHGFKERTTQRENDKGQRIKTTTKLKVQTVTIYTPKRIASRRGLAKFGDALKNNENVTLPCTDYVVMEHPDDQEEDGNKEDPTVKTLQNAIIRRHAAELLVIENQERGDQESSSSSAQFQDGPMGDSRITSSSKYVPPSARPTGPGQESMERQEITVKVSNISRQVQKDDLRDLFDRAGCSGIQRISMPTIRDVKDKDGKVENKGFAYIQFDRKEQGQYAINRLHGHGYDHLLLNLEWAKPPAAGGPGGGHDTANRQHMSGYGTRLAQDSKENFSSL